MPRGYGGVAVLWRKDVDHIVKELQDGNECMQCIELKARGGGGGGHSLVSSVPMRDQRIVEHTQNSVIDI